jgi:hypothetical protein
LEDGDEQGFVSLDDRLQRWDAIMSGLSSWASLS